MSTQKSIKLSDYFEYPYLIPKIYLDFAGKIKSTYL